jgi:hypothetical protein
MPGPRFASAGASHEQDACAAAPVASPPAGRALSLLGLVVPVLAVAAASDTRSHRRTAIILAVLCAAANADGLAHVTNLPREVGAAAALLFLAYTTYLLLNGVLRSRCVTSDVIAGALASYLMIGLTWAIAYGLVETMAPGSIVAPGSAPVDLQTVVYFSFITLMTIGFGDVTPLSTAARTLAVFEGLIGVAFTTIILAVLVAILLREGKDG